MKSSGFVHKFPKCYAASLPDLPECRFCLLEFHL